MSESFPSVEVSIFSSLLLSLCWGQLPLSQHMITAALHWNTTLSHDAGPVTGLTVVSLSYMSLWGKGSAPCLQAKALCLSVHIKGLMSRPPMLWRKATGWCQDPHKVLPIRWVYLGRDVSANEILFLARYTEGVDYVGKWTHLAWGVGTDFRVYILQKTCFTLTWLAGTNMKCGISSTNLRWQGWKIPFVFKASPTNNLTWLKQMGYGLFFTIRCLALW